MKKKVDKDIYRKKNYTPPEAPIEISGSNKEELVRLKESIHRLRHFDSPTEEDKRTLRLHRKLYDLGLKGFNVSYFTRHELDIFYLTGDISHYQRLYKDKVKEREKREKDLQKIFKILDKYPSPINFTVINNVNLNCPYREALQRSPRNKAQNGKHKELLCGKGCKSNHFSPLFLPSLEYTHENSC